MHMGLQASNIKDWIFYQLTKIWCQTLFIPQDIQQHVFKFLFRHVMASWTLKFIFDHLFLRCLTKEERRKEKKEFSDQGFLSDVDNSQDSGERDRTMFIDVCHFNPLTNIQTLICIFACEMTITFLTALHVTIRMLLNEIYYLIYLLIKIFILLKTSILVKILSLFLLMFRILNSVYSLENTCSKINIIKID